MQSTIFKVDLGLIKKYGKPGPRYTSYPTAPQFYTAFRPVDFQNALKRNIDTDRPLSLYFHIPFCAKLCYFCGCTMMVTHNQDRIREYVDYLIREIVLLARATGGRPVKQIHWGGGTPTYLPPDEILRLAEATNRHYNIARDAEVGVEIDPREATKTHFQALKDGGFNRISMGVQDFHQPTQQAINRIQPEHKTRGLVDLVRSMAFESINLDFIYGLPYQTRTTFSKTLEKLIDIHPDRIALFNYAHVPWMKKHQKLIKEETLPTADERLNILKLAIERLTEAGYVLIGMDHFALPGDSLVTALKSKTLYRNFQGYSTHASCDLIAHGMSGISQTDSVYAQNTKSIPDYYRAIAANHPATERGYRLSLDDHLRREIIMRLMCDFSLDFDKIEELFDIHFESYFEEAFVQLEPFILDGLITIRERKIRVTEIGRLLIRNIAMPFDKYLQQKSEVRFSKTI